MKRGEKMKDVILKLKIIMTNFSRILMSFLFVNVGIFFGNKVQAAVSCYYSVRNEDIQNVSNVSNVSDFDIGNVFFIFVPIVIIIVVATIVIIKYKNKKKQYIEKKGAKKDNDKQN